MKIIFGFEIAGHARGIMPQTVRERGNAAAHEAHSDDILYSVLQEDLTNAQRASLEDIYILVRGRPPTLTDDGHHI
jgi:hypothetical protein